MVDIHIHVIPGIDDGSDNIEESLSMLRIAAAQGVTSVVATPHSSAFDFGYDQVLRAYADLQNAVSEQKIPVRVLLGAEILCYESDMDEVIHYLQMGIYPTLNRTRYVLAEFDPHATAGMEEMHCCTDHEVLSFLLFCNILDKSPESSGTPPR